MANDENLIPLNERTKSEQRAITSAGGKASGAARRRRKTLKEELLALLESEDMQERISVALLTEALEGNKAGSVTKAFEVIRDTIGEKPAEKVMFAEVEQSVIDEVEAAVLGNGPETSD